MSLISKSVDLGVIEVPFFDGKISMLPFDLSSFFGVPKEFVATVRKMTSSLNKKTGTAFLTVHGAFVEKDKTLRRGAPLIDGNYLKSHKWGSTGGWKIGENGAKLNTKNHALSYKNNNGGMIIASNYSSSVGWNGIFKGEAGIGGDCRHIELRHPFKLEADKIYYGNSQFIHESLPVDKDVHRVMIRITLPIDHKYQH